MTVRRFALVGLLLGLVFALAACSGSTPNPAASGPNAVLGKQWGLTGASTRAADLTKAGITARFEQDQVAGFSGVNTYSGACVLGTDGSVKIGPLASTKMAGPKALMDAESTYLSMLQAASAYSVQGPVLMLLTKDATLTYQAQEPTALPGSKWIVTGYNNGKQAVVSVSLGSTLTLDVNTDATVSGLGGVSTFNGPFTASETTVNIGPLASTKKAGPSNLMEQEVLYMTALQTASRWEVANGRLQLRDSNGALQVDAKRR